MNISNPGVPVLDVNETRVFSGTSPNPIAWTDLYLAAIVGTNKSVVLLKCYNASASAKWFTARINGDTELAYNAEGANRCLLQGTNYGMIVAMTDAAGIMEWYYTQADQAGVTIDVIAFWPASA